LMEMGIETGLRRGLITRDDEIAHWRAAGEMTQRDIVKKITEIEKISSSKAAAAVDGSADGDRDKVIPLFDSKKGLKKFVPSVYIDRDFSVTPAASTTTSAATKTKVLPPSRGFGFVEFTEHAHALACLRELNNNLAYSSEYVAGGKKAIEMKQRIQKKGGKNNKTRKTNVDSNINADDLIGSDGKVKIPRLIVEFTVENKAKAKKQAEKKALQLESVAKQRKSQREEAALTAADDGEEDGDIGEEKEGKKKGTTNKKNKKKSRGALQRERKRNRKEVEGDIVTTTTNDDNGNGGDVIVSDPKKRNDKKDVAKSTTATRRQRDVDGNDKENDGRQKKKRDAAPTLEDEDKVQQQQQKTNKKRRRTGNKVEVKEELAFEDMVRSYKKSFGGAGGDDVVAMDTGKEEKNGKEVDTQKKARWYD